MGLIELIAGSLKECVDLACALASDLGKLAGIPSSLRDRRRSIASAMRPASLATSSPRTEKRGSADAPKVGHNRNHPSVWVANRSNPDTRFTVFSISPLIQVLAVIFDPTLRSILSDTLVSQANGPRA